MNDPLYAFICESGHDLLAQELGSIDRSTVDDSAEEDVTR